MTRQTLRRLPLSQHKAIVVRFLEGRSIDDIATFHALRRQTVESAIRDGLIHALSLVPDPPVSPVSPDAAGETPRSTRRLMEDNDWRGISEAMQTVTVAVTTTNPRHERRRRHRGKETPA